jgi:hypothetical protein
MNSYLLDAANLSSTMASNLSINHQHQFPKVDLLKPLRNWLDSLEIKDSKLAHKICQLVPAQCPFERDIKFFGHTLFHIPPMCKLNPLYEEVVALRFRAICYLADECGEDISQYC